MDKKGNVFVFSKTLTSNSRREAQHVQNIPSRQLLWSSHDAIQVRTNPGTFVRRNVMDWTGDLDQPTAVHIAHYTVHHTVVYCTGEGKREGGDA